MTIYSVSLYNGVGRKQYRRFCATLEVALRLVQDAQDTDTPWQSVSPCQGEHMAWEEDEDWFPARLVIQAHDVIGLEDPRDVAAQAIDLEIERVKHTSHHDGMGMGDLNLEEALGRARDSLKR